MDKRPRTQHLALAVIAALHLGLLALVLIKPKVQPGGVVTYMDLLRVVPIVPKPQAKPVPSAKPAQTTTRTAVRPKPATAAEPVAAQADALPGAIATAPPESAAPDFAAASVPLNLDQMRRQAALNERERVKTPMEKVHEEELRRKSVETAVAAAAKAGARKDCQNGYGGLGIFAIIPLVYGTVTDKGCKWK
jgi:hypothetical protein